ncbi:MAG: ribose-5-phosphate isomerase [Clostridiaceae bacterium]|nr:ribose-5-phosphate isomerase [Clostridiaceae bacterium]
MINKYEKILTVICDYNGINREGLICILKDKKYKYLLLLFLKKYKCFDLTKLKEDFSMESKKSINYGCKKAEEKFFVNKEFRELYFEMEEMISKII